MLCSAAAQIMFIVSQDYCCLWRLITRIMHLSEHDKLMPNSIQVHSRALLSQCSTGGRWQNVSVIVDWDAGRWRGRWGWRWWGGRGRRSGNAKPFALNILRPSLEAGSKRLRHGRLWYNSKFFDPWILLGNRQPSHYEVVLQFCSTCLWSWWTKKTHFALTSSDLVCFDRAMAEVMKKMMVKMRWAFFTAMCLTLRSL